MSIRVVVAEDDYLMREGIRRVLESAPDITVVAECADGEELLVAVDREAPNVVVTDIRMPPSDVDEGIRIANRLRRTHPQVGVLVLSQFVEPEYALALLERDRIAAPTSSRSASTTGRPSSARSARWPLAGPRSTRRSLRVWSPGAAVGRRRR